MTAMTHDPMCDVRSSVRMLIPPYAGCERCELISRVREDECMSFDRSKEYLAYEMALRDAVEAVKAAMPDEDEGWEKSIAVAWMRHAVAALEALGGER